MSVMDGRQRLGLLDLPAELLVSTWAHLPNRDIKSLRLTCSHFRDTTTLRLDRIFLSANPRNIEVFCAVATHDVYRRQIKELIYDDARLKEYTHDYRFVRRQAEARGLRFSPPPPEEAGCPPSYDEACRQNIEDLEMRKQYDADRPDHQQRARRLAAVLKTRDSWEIYQELRRQQEEVIQMGSDIECLRKALTANWFPSLKRVTITPAAHGMLFNPLYETPMIRAFPFGFNYAMARGWPVFTHRSNTSIKMPAWDEEEEQSKEQWRGFRLVTDLLAHISNHSVSELNIDVSQLMTGINCRIFDQPYAEQESLAKLLRRPGFERIDLALMVGGQEHVGWPAFRSGHLRRTLAEAPDLKHVSLRTDNQEIDPDVSTRWLNEPDCHFVPLRTVFPVDRWLHLSHFGLGHFIVKQLDLTSLLSALPALRSVEFFCLMFLEGSHRGLLEDMRDTLGWRQRIPEARVRIAFGLEAQPCSSPERKVWIDREVSDFVYGAGENPFMPDSGRNVVSTGKGVIRDPFEPAHERPNVAIFDLVRLGYCTSEWVEGMIRNGNLSAELDDPPTYIP